MRGGCESQRVELEAAPHPGPLSVRTGRGGRGRAVAGSRASTCSSACATASTRASAPLGPITWMPNGMPHVIDAAGDRRGAGQRQGRRVGDGEPAHVGRHLLAVDLLDEQLRMRERRDGSGRRDQHVDVLEEGEEAPVDLGLLHVRARHVGERELQAALDVVDDVAVEQLARLLHPLAVQRPRTARRAAPRRPRARLRNRARAPAPP